MAAGVMNQGAGPVIVSENKPVVPAFQPVKNVERASPRLPGDLNTEEKLR
jgi:hypothetical protein